jgi:hypothetical protein
MSDKILIIFGTWIFSDSLYSLILYIPKDEPFWKCHSIRVIRHLIGLSMMIFV